jgi:DNA-binding transcriptional MocR family regulator
MFVWVELPEKVNTKAMLETAVTQEKVAYIPGYAFAVDGRQAMNCMRLNFTTSTEAQIETAVARLGRVIKRELAGM